MKKQVVAFKKKLVAFTDLEVGKKYFVVCGIWSGIVTYVGSEVVGKRIKYRFTYGELDNWKNQFGHFETKSGIKVYEL